MYLEVSVSPTLIIWVILSSIRTLALIKPDAVTKIGDVLEVIYTSNLIVTKAKMTTLTW